ncbi:MAG: diaminopimelate epimerase [Armatimonadota bacterium]
MSKVIEFTKTQGIGNDFVIVNLLAASQEHDWQVLAVKMCDRNFGIGADGLILVMPSDIADYRMRIINSDGSEPEMCGNGIRCFVRYLLDNGLATTPISIETLAGIKTVDVVQDDTLGARFRVNMGQPALNADDIPVKGYGTDTVISQPLEVDGGIYQITCVSMGNPHCIIFVQCADDIQLAQIGARIETHPAFPRKTNVEFVQILPDGDICIRVWERGAGITLACGTGACASVVASILNNRIERKPTTAHLPGGDLIIDWNIDDDVYMTGPAQVVFTGIYHTEE